MKKFIIVVVAVLIAASAIMADAIVNEEEMDSLYTDHKAYKVGDVVTIMVVESTQGSQTASLKTQKKSRLSGGMGMSSWGGGVLSPFPYVPSWGAGGEEYQDGGGKSSRSGSLVAQISGRIIRVLSNGNLVIKGTKVIKGTIRPQDIGSDNVIYSTYVADATIEYEGRGPIGEKTSPGILTRIFDWLGIF